MFYLENFQKIFYAMKWIYERINNEGIKKHTSNRKNIIEFIFDGKIKNVNVKGYTYVVLNESK